MKTQKFIKGFVILGIVAAFYFALSSLLNLISWCNSDATCYKDLDFFLISVTTLLFSFFVFCGIVGLYYLNKVNIFKDNSTTD
jgi:hypothetical protein